MDGSCVTLDSYRGYIDAAASAYYILSLASDTGKYIYLFVGYIQRKPGVQSRPGFVLVSGLGFPLGQSLPNFKLAFRGLLIYS